MPTKYEDFTAAELDAAYAEVAEILNETRGPSYKDCIQVSPGLYSVRHDKKYVGVPTHFAATNHAIDCNKTSCWTCYKIWCEHLNEMLNRHHCLCIWHIMRDERKIDLFKRLRDAELKDQNEGTAVE